jgi:hypothetical protein
VNLLFENQTNSANENVAALKVVSVISGWCFEHLLAGCTAIKHHADEVDLIRVSNTGADHVGDFAVFPFIVIASKRELAVRCFIGANDHALVGRCFQL